MGAAASTNVPDTLTKEQAQAIAGDRFDEAAFDAAANDGIITKDAFLAGIPKSGKNSEWDSGGKAGGDPKDSPDFQYLTYETCPEWNTDADSKLFHKSLMAKNCTPELFEKLKDVKTDTGYTFSNAIQTGTETPHLGVGITAGDEDCYVKFGELKTFGQSWQTCSSICAPFSLVASLLTLKPRSSTQSSRAGTAATTRPP